MAKTPSRMLPLKTPLPKFALPECETGEIISQEHGKSSKLLLVMFICNHCPYVVLLKKDIAALRDQCPHRFAPLRLGSVSDGILQCPYHGLAFGADGECVRNPQGPVPKAARVRAYATRTGLSGHTQNSITDLGKLERQELASCLIAHATHIRKEANIPKPHILATLTSHVVPGEVAIDQDLSDARRHLADECRPDERGAVVCDGGPAPKEIKDATRGNQTRRK